MENWACIVLQNSVSCLEELLKISLPTAVSRVARLVAAREMREVKRVVRWERDVVIFGVSRG